ncbi:unnamed protein product [Spirodela intermedia]|uniref:Uncharacterized protein n=1 Tax=Spirodela intermedia TaxID=51605 RepID=A0A7I8JUW1_SPIIN|nr:unnamed protein product [Spirodela intermedia]CAA6673521.1 unnamed protein product [Spirodela intermedia]
MELGGEVWHISRRCLELREAWEDWPSSISVVVPVLLRLQLLLPVVSSGPGGGRDPGQVRRVRLPSGSSDGRGFHLVEAFFDPICPDSRDAWPPLKRITLEYAPRIFLEVHPFPLPYHDNSFFSCRALHISNKLNRSTTYPLLELFFEHQEKLYNQPTRNISRESVIRRMVKLATKATGDSSQSTLERGFEDLETDLAARTSFKYGCSRGVIGTPFFIVNGFPLPGAGSALDYDQWRSIIDPLVSNSSSEDEGTTTL